MDKIKWLLGHSRLFWIVATLGLGLMLGTAGQNIALGLAFLLAAPSRWKNGENWIPARSPYLVMMGILLVYLFWTLCATAFNPLNLTHDSVGNFIGFLPLAILPWFLSHELRLKSGETRKLERWMLVLVTIWALICISQAIFGWRLSGWQELNYSELYSRARGLYSHPLTLAYVALVFWPALLIRALHEPRRLMHWGLLLGAALLIALSQSRMVQVLAGLCLLGNLAFFLRGRIRIAALASAVFMGGLMLGTSNPISIRLYKTLSAKNTDNSSPYPDDRIVFWQAHWQMIRERPILGHGIHLNVDYRRPYYEKIGQGEFQKHYEAHNQFIQILAENGLIGLGLFIAWLAAAWRFFGSLPSIYSQIARQSLLVFLLGTLTQNSFHDSEVRYALLFGMLLLIIVKARAAENPA